MILRVGLTGGLASGKSSVGRLLARHGADVLDADALVHELYGPGQPGARAVRELFGHDVLDPAGAVDRNALAARVVRDQEALGRLGGAIHPLVRSRVDQWFADLALAPPVPPLGVVEAALLLETGAARGYDLVVVVWCERQQQLERAAARGMNRARAEALVDAQLSLDAKRDLADLVIDNSGSAEDLVERASWLWRELGRRARPA